jgi:hypothetical protein
LFKLQRFYIFGGTVIAERQRPQFFSMDINPEKETIRFYKFYFFGIDLPVTIEAWNKKEAMADMRRLATQIPQLQGKGVRAISVELPVLGVSEKRDRASGVLLVWVGLKKSNTGWMEKTKYEYELAQFNKKQNKAE